ncbi:hypothetical protein SARC_17842, partial [Sphaeroforma arctica JP610]
MPQRISIEEQIEALERDLAAEVQRRTGFEKAKLAYDGKNSTVTVSSTNSVTSEAYQVANDNLKESRLKIRQLTNKIDELQKAD